MQTRVLAYPLLRLLRRLVFFISPIRTSTYDDENLARETVSGDITNFHKLSSNGCHVWDLTIANQPKLNVLDFGGGSGRCGFEGLRKENVTWAVVETPSMAKLAGELFTAPGLMYFDSPSKASRALGRVDILHVSSALQYTDRPSQTLETLLKASPKMVVLKN